MRVVRLGLNGVSPAKAELINGKGGQFYAFCHGDNGRGRWELRFPLAVREFPPAEQFIEPGELQLIPLHKQDARGNDLFLLARGPADGKQLVLFDLAPGYRGGATYRLEGEVRLLGEGYEAQGLAGRMGGAPCPALLVSGPCRIYWQRTGRLYGSPANWVADYDGAEWIVAPEDECSIESAALTY